MSKKPCREVKDLLVFFRQPEKMLKVLSTTPYLSSYNGVHFMTTLTSTISFNPIPNPISQISLSSFYSSGNEAQRGKETTKGHTW